MERTALKANTVRVERDFGLDNLRFFLIFCVVLGHLLEICPPFWGSNFLYQLIYSFHIPALLFLFGYFSRFSPGKLLFGWVIPYFLFQTIYILFENYLLGAALPLQYGTPYWILWFLMVCIYYQLLIPLYRVNQPLRRGLAVGISVLLALLVGCTDSIGYLGSLSRFFVFQPFFLLGLYSRGRLPERGSRWGIALCSLGIFGVCAFLLYRLELPNAVLYGARSYDALGFHPSIRLLLLFMGLCMTVFLVLGLRPLLKKRLPVITPLGQNTLPIFLLHGFGVKLIGKYLPGLVERPWQVLFVAIGLVLLLGNPLLGKAFHYIFSDRLFSRKKP